MSSATNATHRRYKSGRPKMAAARSGETERRHKAMLAHGGNVTDAAAALNMKRTTLRDWTKDNPTPGAAVQAQPLGKVRRYAEAGKTRVVLMTAAQDDTPLYDGAFHALQDYAAYRGGDLFVGGFTYQKGLFEDQMVHTGAFAQKVIPFMTPEVVNLADRLQWYGKANILPTATDPLTGWDTPTRDKWGIFPHAKIALKCVPVMPSKPGKVIMTTGVITKPNYIQRNAGQKAEFHHTPAATIAEIKPNGEFFVRQIGIERDGSFQDLDIRVEHDKAGNTFNISKGNPVESITWGDVHFEEMDHDIAKVQWGWMPPHAGRMPLSGNMLDDMHPSTQFFHDSFSQKPRSHHTINDPHERGILHNLGGVNDSIIDMLSGTAGFLRDTTRDWCKSIHVPSNHNNHLHSWLKNPDAMMDAVNARIWHRLNLAWWDAIDSGEGERFNAHAWALRNAGTDLSSILFLGQGQSYTICHDTAPIECGLHGDIGPRGSRGNAHNLSRIVERVNIAHSHEPRIREAAYQAGTSSRLDLRYASKGPGAWHWANIITYPNGKRTLVFPTYEGYHA